jgi:hypothetical protein
MGILYNNNYLTEETYFLKPIPFDIFIYELKECVLTHTSWKEMENKHVNDDKRMLFYTIYHDSDLFYTNQTRHDFIQMMNMLYTVYYRYNRKIGMP